MGSSPRGDDSRLADAALWICFASPLARREPEEARSRCCRGLCPSARLFLGARKVLPVVNRSKESRRPDESENVASGVVLLSPRPRRGFIYGLLSENGSGGDLSGRDVFLRFSGAAGFGWEARGQRSIKRNQTVIVVKSRQVPVSRLTGKVRYSSAPGMYRSYSLFSDAASSIRQGPWREFSSWRIPLFSTETAGHIGGSFVD